MFIQFHSLLSQLSKPFQTLSVTKRLHSLIIRNQLSNDPFYATRIVRFYAINGDLVSARNLFDGTPLRSVYLWNSLIRAYAQAHAFSDAFRLFDWMICSEIKPDNFTFACLMRACSDNFDLERLRILHGEAIVHGFGSESICSSALVAAYSKLGLIDPAREVFNGMPDPDLVLWNSMISGYGCCGKSDKGLMLFKIMQIVGKKPDGYTLVGLISGLVDPGLLDIGHGIHCYCLKTGFDSNSHIGSVLVSMYSRCKCIESACGVFNSLYDPDLVTWSSLITGFSQSGDHKKALSFFRKMIMEGRNADPVLISSVLAASAQLAVLVPGIEIHGYAIRHCLDSDITVSSALIDMYSKCGFLSLGIRVFEKMADRNIVSYNSIISGLGLYGRPNEAFEMFEEVLEKGFKPDESTFSAVLCACCHAGLVKDGREIFRRMRDEFGIKPKNDHYVYIVKLLGMGGELEEAYDLIMTLQEPVDSGILGAFLSCCDVHRNTELAEIVAERLFQKTPEGRAYEVMVSKVYAGNGRWDDVEKLRGGRKRKMPGVSWIGMY